VRWHYRDAGLLWPFVPAYIIHVAEEWFAGFPAWVATATGRPLPASAFFANNGTALLLLVAGTRAAIRDERHGWIAVTVATIALVNTLAHAAGAALTRSYAPGLVSAVVLYVPLGTLTMIRAADRATPGHLSRGIAAGIVIHALVFGLAYASARIGGAS
jgi:hypothetical protein